MPVCTTLMWLDLRDKVSCWVSEKADRSCFDFLATGMHVSGVFYKMLGHILLLLMVGPYNLVTQSLSTTYMLCGCVSRNIFTLWPMYRI